MHTTSTDLSKGWTDDVYSGFNTSGACAPVTMNDGTITLFYRDSGGGGVMVQTDFA